MPRRLRYQVAVTLDGFIAGPNGEYDWIVDDPTIDMGALFREFDTVVMGRKTYDTMRAQQDPPSMPGVDVVVFSRSLPAGSAGGMRITREDPREVVAALKQERGKDIWLFGGGELFRTLLDAGLVDTVELAVMPVMIGSGIPVLPAGARTKLELADHKRLPSGISMLAYSVSGGLGPAPRIRWIKPAKKQSKKTAKRPATKKSSVRRRGRR